MDVLTLIRKNALNEPVADEERQAILRFVAESPDELARLRADLEAAASERDQARGELTAIRRSGRVREIARGAGFLDAEYLDYLLQQKGVAVDDEGACREVIERLKESAPRLFRIELQPGAGSIPAAPGVRAGGIPAGWDGDIAKLLCQAPEIQD